MNARAGALAATLAVALLAAAGGAYWYLQARGDRGEAISRLLLQLSLPDLGGQPRPLNAWQGQVLVINFWATWCAPCREEVPGLVRIQQAYGSKGVQIVGISVDSSAKVAEFSKEFEVNYPLVLGGLESIELLRQLGNSAGALPFTVVLDRNGKVASTHLGALQERDLVRILQGLLA